MDQTPSLRVLESWRTHALEGWEIEKYKHFRPRLVCGYSSDESAEKWFDEGVAKSRKSPTYQYSFQDTDIHSTEAYIARTANPDWAEAMQSAINDTIDTIEHMKKTGAWCPPRRWTTGEPGSSPTGHQK
jgi:hypothetical protein